MASSSTNPPLDVLTNTTSRFIFLKASASRRCSFSFENGICTEIRSEMASSSSKSVNLEALLSGCSIKGDRKSTRLNSSHVAISYAVFCLKKKNTANHKLSPQKHTLRHIRQN